MKRIASLSLATMLLSGCFLYDCGYTRDDDTAIYKTDSSNKMPITYSLNFATSLPPGSPGSPTEKSIRTKIYETLNQTGLFSSVSYGDKSENGYHLEFTYNDCGYNEEEAMARAIIYVYTLFMIPIPEEISSDLSAVLYLEGKPIWSVAKTEKCRCIVCWYALPVGIVCNYWSVWRAIEYNIVRAVINDATKEHIKRYLDPSSVELTNPRIEGRN